MEDVLHIDHGHIPASYVSLPEGNALGRSSQGPRWDIQKNRRNPYLFVWFRDSGVLIVLGGSSQFGPIVRAIPPIFIRWNGHLQGSIPTTCLLLGDVRSLTVITNYVIQVLGAYPPSRVQGLRGLPVDASNHFKGPKSVDVSKAPVNKGTLDLRTPWLERLKKKSKFRIPFSYMQFARSWV